jgi:hypothetical protein
MAAIERTVRRPVARGVTTLDLLILAAALIISIPMARQWLIDTAAYTLETWSTSLSLTWAALALALLVIRMVPPRPPLFKVARQPGFQVSLTVAMCIVDGFISRAALGLRLKLSYGVTFSSSTEYLDSVSLFWLGPAVAVVWIVLAFCGRWRPERSWIDRFGRLLGFAWILGYILFMLCLCARHWSS